MTVAQFLNGIVSEGGYLCKNLQILPDDMVKEILNGSGLNDDAAKKDGNGQTSIIAGNSGCVIFQNDSVSGKQEIIVSKTAFVEIFVTCYKYLYQDTSDGDKNEDEEAKILDLPNLLYNHSLGILLATPLDSTAIIQNSEMVINSGSFLRLKNVFLTLSCYLTCNYEKTNKSSCLWAYFRQVYVELRRLLEGDQGNANSCRGNDLNLNGISFDDLKMHISNTIFNSTIQLDLFVIWTCLNSIKVHSRNYYACNSMRFFLKNMDINMRVAMIRMSMQWVWKEDIDDLSLWTILSDSVIDLKFDIWKGYLVEFGTTGVGGSFADADADADVVVKAFVEEFYRALKQWCFGIGAGLSYSAMYALYRVNGGLEIDSHLNAELRLCYQTFERENNGIIDVERQCLVDSHNNEITFDNNLSIHKQFQQSLNSKKVLQLRLVHP